MAMSQGERIARLQEQSNRYLSRRQTKDCSLQTIINQAKASKVVQPQHRGPGSYAIQGSKTVGQTDKAVYANVYTSYASESACCAQVVASGTETFNQTQAVLQKAQACAVCSDPDYSLYNGYSIDLSGPNVIGGVCCPLPNLPNTAKTTAAEKCASCLRFYFPSPTPRKCTFCTPYPSSALYPRLPPAWEDGRYGDDRVPQQPGCSGPPTMSELVALEPSGDSYSFTFNYTGQNVLVSGSITGEYLTTWSLGEVSLGTVTFNSVCVSQTSNVTVTITLQNECGQISKSITFTAFVCPT